jgi:hypothetical protein
MKLTKIALLLTGLIILTLVVLAFAMVLTPQKRYENRDSSFSKLEVPKNDAQQWNTYYISDDTIQSIPYDQNTHWIEVNKKKEMNDKFYAMRAQRLREQGKETGVYN